MTTATGIRVYDEPGGGVRIVLPRRELGKLRLLAIPVLAVAGITAYALYRNLVPYVVGPTGSGAMGLFIAAFMAIPVLALLSLVSLLLRTRCEVRLRGDSIRLSERGGLLLTKSWKRPVSHLRKLVVHEAPLLVNGRKVERLPWNELAFIFAHFDDGSRWAVAAMYRMAVVRELAAELEHRLRDLVPMTDGGEFRLQPTAERKPRRSE